MRAGPLRRTPRPQERAGTARGTVRATSPAPIFGGLRGVPAEGVGGDGAAAPAQGKAFPLNSLSHSTRVIDFARFTTKRDARPRHVGLELRQE